ncbi:MAG: hypothetical protein ABH950_05935 [Candidatus Altiarchaeota archaeon]
MSFSTVAAQAVFFTVVLTVFVLLVSTYNDYITDTGAEVLGQHNSLKDRLETDIKVIGFTYDNSTTPDNVAIILENSGETKLKTNCIDAYIDRVWVADDTITITLLNTSFDPTLWNPGEQARIDIEENLLTGDHELSVVTCEGVLANKLFYTCCG